EEKGEAEEDLAVVLCYRQREDVVIYLPRSKDDPGKGSYWAIDTNPKEDSVPSRPKRGRAPEKRGMQAGVERQSAQSQLLIGGRIESSALYFQASTPYSLESDSLRMDCIMSGGASPTLAINAVTNKSMASVNLNNLTTAVSSGSNVHGYTPVSSHSEPSSQSLSLQQPVHPPPPPPTQPQYGLPVPSRGTSRSVSRTSRTSALLSAVFTSVSLSSPSHGKEPRRLMRSVELRNCCLCSPSDKVPSICGQGALAEKNKTVRILVGLMGMPGDSSQPPRTACSYQHSPGAGNGVGHHHQHAHGQASHHSLHSQQHLSPHSGHSQQQTGTPNLDWLKESCRIATSYNWADVDLSPFQGLKESMRQAELNNWSLDPAQMSDLCSSINQFFTATGVIPRRAPPQPQVQHPTPPGAPQHPAQPHGAMHPKASQHNQHGQHNQHHQHISTGNMYIDSRQSISSLMGPPGYPHISPMSNTAPTMTGHLIQLSQQHRLPLGHFQVRRMLAAEDIQDDFDWDSIV
ncbi:hypothetical protein KUCAC02_012521, partial [Chaenocephalus aceratus]